MPSPNLWLAALGPLTLLAVGLVPGNLANRYRGAIVAMARIAALLAFAVAIIAGAAVVLTGPLSTGLTGVAGVGFSLYLDALSAIMFVLVSFIGVIVVAYSRNYLDGDPDHGQFISRLCLTLAAVLALIISGNLLQFSLAWIVTSLGLHGLLTFYRERPAATLAARKKFLASRLGDLCLITAMLLIHRAFGSLEYSAVFAGAGAMVAGEGIPSSIHAIAILLACAALLKSAQFPLHGWLIEVMETPTPVSALLHAGIINAGGFLLLRFSDVMVLSTPALDTLTIIGGFTAVFGSTVMLTQTSVKVSLAYSTTAQMGFMMLQCGLGSFSSALLHIMAHSLYKAHAFLSSGSVIDIARSSWSPSPGGQPHPARLALAIVAVLAVTLLVGWALGVTLVTKPGVFALGAVVLLGLVHLIANGIDERPNIYVIGKTVGLAVVVALSYFGLQLLMERLLAGSLAATESQRGPLGVAIVAAVVLSFATLTVFQSVLPRQAGRPRWQALYAHISNGFYVNTLANRWILQFWPSPPPPQRSLSHVRSPENGAQA